MNRIIFGEFPNSTTICYRFVVSLLHKTNSTKLKVMTTNQITTKLNKANISLECLTINRNEIEICLGYTETENNGHKFGSCNGRKVNSVRRQIQKSLPEFNGGYSTGYGAFILQIGYRSNSLASQNID